MADKAIRRINALVSEEVFSTLKTIAEDESTTVTEVLKRSIGLCKWFHNAKREGARVIVERNGKQYEVAFF